MSTIIILLYITGSSAQNQNIKVSVKITVDAENSEIYRDKLISFINRELRTLGDIEVVESNEDFQLMILCMQNFRRTQNINSLTISALSLMSIYWQGENVFAYFDITMFTTNKDVLKSTSQDIVAWFDTNTLEKFRGLKK
ncbi:hypothetical protein KKA87_10975 [bacterium]|nr:hypothetical protein [bacterium]